MGSNNLKRKLLIVLGAICFSLLISGLISVFLFNHLCKKMDDESIAFIDNTIPLIVGAWNSKELVTQASLGLLVSSLPEDIALVFN